MMGIESHRREGSGDWRLEDVRGTGEKVAVVFSWRTRDGSRTRWAQLLTVRDGTIVAMRDHGHPARALRAAAR